MLRTSSIACLTLLGAGCAPAAESGGFENPNPAARMYAIEQAMEQRDRTVTPQIVEQLDSDDPAVRLLAIGALRRLWNEDFGYQYDDPVWERNAAIGRWKDAVDNGRLDEGMTAAEAADG